MSDLTDDDIACWLSVELAPPLVDALRELQRHRAAVVADKERVRAVVREALDESFGDPWRSNDSAYRLAIADRVAEQLATPAVRLSAEELADVRTLRETLDELDYLCELPRSVAVLDRLIGAKP